MLSKWVIYSEFDPIASKREAEKFIPSRDPSHEITETHTFSTL